MIKLDVISEKLEIALLQKQNINYKTIIIAELAKEDWQNRKFKLDELLNSIKSSEDFDKYQKSLTKLFEDLYEVITAPGVDDFIGWLNDLTVNKNETNTKKLRKFLVDNFSEFGISDLIETIICNKDSLKIEKSIFQSLINEIKKDIQQDSNDFINKPDEFENNIEAFLELLNKRLIDFNATEELKYVEQKELYTKEQVEKNIDWYYDIIDKIIECNQSLKAIDTKEKESNTGPVSKMKSRIKDIQSCIEILYNCDIENNKDDVFKNVFLRFAIENIKFEGGIKNNLDDFMENKWSDIEINYNNISLFFNEKKNISFNNKWEDYSQKDELKSLILSYTSILKENPLLSIQNQKSTLSIQQTLSKKTNSIDAFNLNATSTKNNIIETFEKILTEYKDKNILLENIANSSPKLKLIIEEIKTQIEGLNSGIEALKKANDIIEYLSESFNYDLNSYSEITNLFKKALKESGMTDHLKWLEGKLNGSNIGQISLTDLQDSILISELLEKGLVKINIEKQF